jgi:hypothetical protein
MAINYSDFVAPASRALTSHQLNSYLYVMMGRDVRMQSAAVSKRKILDIARC